MEPGFNVALDELRSHATTVSNVAGQVRSEARGSEGSVAGAFGQIAEFFATAVSAAGVDLRGVIGKAGDSVDDVHAGLRATTDGYQTIETHNASVFGGGTRGVGGQRFAQVQQRGPTDAPGGLTVTLPNGEQFHTTPGEKVVVPKGSTAVDSEGRTVIDGSTNPNGGRLEGGGTIRVVPPEEVPGS